MKIDRSASDAEMLTGHLSPPAGAIEPSGFDFKRHAWFLRLGGLGYTLSPVLMLSPAPIRYTVGRARIRISNHLQQRLSSQTETFGAEVQTDHRTGLNALTVQNLRYSNSAHLRAISGLHMGLFTGFVFALLRLALICLPGLIRYGPIKQTAACGQSLLVRLIRRCRAAMWPPKGLLLWC